MSALLDFDTLKHVLNCTRQADVERLLHKAGIRFFYARAGVWTTMDLVNAAGGLRPAANADTYSPDIIA